MPDTSSMAETVAALSQSVAELNARIRSLEARQTDTEARFERVMDHVRLSKRSVVEGALLPTPVVDESISTRTPGLTPDNNILDQFPAMDEDIKAAFLEEVRLTIADEDSAKIYVDYCIKYKLSRWEDYLQTRRLHGTVANKQSDMDEFSKQRSSPS